MPTMDMDGDGVISYAEMQQVGRAGRSKAPSAGPKEINMGSSAPGGATDTNKLTPRPDGPPPTEQQLNMGPYAGRHTGGWKMKDALLEPDSAHLGPKAADGNGDRLTSMSNVHGTWFSQKQLKQRWFEKHNTAHDTKPAETIHERLYPLDRQTDVGDGDEEGLSYSPWEPTTEDMTPMSKSIGQYVNCGKPGGPKKAAIQPQPKPPSKGPAAKKEVKPVGKGIALSDNPAWGNASGRNWGSESLLRPDPAMGYTGHEFARRFDKGEEDLSMASRIARRRMQSVERRFGSSPYAHEIAMAVQEMGDGVDYTGPKDYGWATFPPKGLTPDGNPYEGNKVIKGMYG